MTRHGVLAVFALGACADFGPTVAHDEVPTVAASWGAIDGVVTGAGYPARLGPSGARWADTDARAYPFIGVVPGTPRALGGSPLVVLDGLAISHDGVLFAVDLESGDEVWRGTLNLAPGSVATDGDLLCGVEGSTTLALVCVGLTDGLERWRTALGEADAGWPPPYLVLFGSDRVGVFTDNPTYRGHFAAHDAQTGAFVFGAENLLNTPRAALATDDAWLVVDDCGDHACVRALDGSTGAEQARLQLPDLVTPSGDTVRSLGATPLWIDGDEVVYGAATQQNALAPAWTVGAWRWDGAAFTDVSSEVAPLYAALPASAFGTPHGPRVHSLVDVGVDGTALILGERVMCAIDASDATVTWCGAVPGDPQWIRAYADRISTELSVHLPEDGTRTSERGLFAYERWVFDPLFGFGSIQ